MTNAEFVACHPALFYSPSMSKLYIHRKLHRSEQLICDDDLLEQSGVFVVLAEPGAGKSDLLDYLAERNAVSRERASVFVHRPPSSQPALFIDSLDEVARISEDKINEIIVKARATGAGRVIFASRSYVWDEARTRFVRDCFGTEPTILRLEPFDDEEQRHLFDHYVPGECFETFKAETDRLELSPILGNPQFLKLFADAYVEGDRRFSSKRQIYADALRRLASESKASGGFSDRPQTERILAAANEILAKLLLSGAEGVSAREEIGDDAYPYLRAVGPDDRVVTFALNTHIFKPTSSVNKHDPVHRIVAEYCAANHLVDRIQDSGNTLSMKRCLAVIAPNGAVRNELRGMLGWMASLGGRAIQEAVIDIDPYAVLANGDASQILPSSKLRLLKALEALARIDPFFRRMDSWRRFNVAGFFTKDVIEHVRPLLAPTHKNSHLRGLLLELLHGTDASNGLQAELSSILLDPQADMSERDHAYRDLHSIQIYNPIPDFDALISQATRDSLELASDMIVNRSIVLFGRRRGLDLINSITKLYPTEEVRLRTVGSLYFIRQLISQLELDDTRYFLDEITGALGCVCGKEKPFRCNCRRGRSKIAGRLLDRYFELMIGPHDPRQVGRWTTRLIFPHGVKPESSASVQALSSNAGLRRAIQIAAFNGLSTQQEISEASQRFYVGYGHSGLALHEGDYQNIVDYAIESGNHALWENFIVRHSPYRQIKGPDKLRAHMREQARLSASLLRIWTRSERRYREQIRRDHFRFGRSEKTYERMEAKRKEEHFETLRRDRALIEAGRHWGWLKLFARLYLYEPDGIKERVDDPAVVEKALLNCFDFLASHVPSLEMLADRRGTAIAQVLHAACLATFRRAGSLEGIAANVLSAAKTDGVGGSGYNEGEAEKFEAELNRALFDSDKDVIEFARRYIEPRLTVTGQGATGVHILDHGNTFKEVKGQIALDWLSGYPGISFDTRETLFGIAAAHADRTKLNSLIERYCADPVDPSEEGQKRRKFWLLRHFFFIVPTSDAFWAEYSADPKSILVIEQYAGRFARHDAQGWPNLSANQICRILDAFVTAWPKVNLPDVWGTGDPDGETAYRFLRDVVYQIERDAPSNSLPILERLLSDARFVEFHDAFKSQKATAMRQLALSGFHPPRPAEVSRLLDESTIASVEDMRALLIELLDEIQQRLKGAATNPVEVFYFGDDRVDENTARNRIVDMLEARMNALNLAVVVEHQMKDANRCDFTASTSINGSQVILVIEVKGQWHKELFTAASAQLADRYMIYPGAADQGVYLALWFGGDETVAGRKAPAITSADELRNEILTQMPESLMNRIDVYVLDLSRPKKT